MIPAETIRDNVKLAEAVANLQRRRAVNPPPPPYREAIKPESVELDDLYNSEIDDEEEEELAPILIKLDTSINIEGSHNTVIFPMPTGPTGGSPGHPTTASGTAQRYSPSRPAQLARALVSALQEAGALENSETGRKRPIEIDVNARLSIRGEWNTISTGIPKRTNSESPLQPRRKFAGGKRRLSVVRQALFIDPGNNN